MSQAAREPVNARPVFVHLFFQLVQHTQLAASSISPGMMLVSYSSSDGRFVKIKRNFT